jgi:PEP-CTERM motif
VVIRLELNEQFAEILLLKRIVLDSTRKAVIMSRSRLLCAVATALLVAVSPIRARAGQVVAQKIQTFTNPSTTQPAYGFNLTVSGAILAKPAPTSTVFTNVPMLFTTFVANDSVMYSSPVLPPGAAVNPGKNLTVTYSESYNDKTQTGFLRNSKFTNINHVLITPSAAKLALDSSASYNGSLASLSVLNDSGAALTGTVSVYLNPGLSTIFGTDQFDTLLPNAIPVLPTTSFSLADGQPLGASPLTVNVTDDEYLLVLGTVDTSSGTVDFAEAFAAVPEPSTLGMFALGCLTVAGYGCLRRRRAAV